MKILLNTKLNLSENILKIYQRIIQILDEFNYKIITSPNQTKLPLNNKIIENISEFKQAIQSVSLIIAECSSIDKELLEDLMYAIREKKPMILMWHESTNLHARLWIEAYKNPLVEPLVYADEKNLKQYLDFKIKKTMQS